MAQEKKPDETLWQLLPLALELGYIIAVPAVLFALGGRFADRHFGTSPFLLMAGLGLALMLSMTIIYRKVRHLL